MFDHAGQPVSLTDFCNRPAPIVARELIGAMLLVANVGGRIVEAEAYMPDEPASHSFAGKTSRNAAMFGPPAAAYVYLCYGVHWCFNIVCEPGSAVLIRAIGPVFGLETMSERRGTDKTTQLCSGPGKLCQALGITIEHNARPLADEPFRLELPAQRPDIVCGTRIGISKAVDLPWRFGQRGSPFLSKRFAD